MPYSYCLNIMEQQALIKHITDLLEEYKAQDINVFRIEHLASITDTMIICSANSSRHAKTLADKVTHDTKTFLPQTPRIEGSEHCDWILVDLDSIILHIMLPETRALYALEKLWRMEVTPSHPNAS